MNDNYTKWVEREKSWINEKEIEKRYFDIFAVSNCDPCNSLRRDRNLGW